MIQLLGTIVITAVVSSLFTLGLSYAFYILHLRDLLERKLDEKLELAKSKVKEGLREEALDLMPKFRAEVREGFKEALNSAMGGQIIENMTKPVSSVVEASLSFLIGRQEEER
jgi:hypothetical protein